MARSISARGKVELQAIDFLNLSIQQENRSIIALRAFDVSTAELAGNSQPGQQFFGIHISNHGRVMIFAAGVPLPATDRSLARLESAAAAALRMMQLLGLEPPLGGFYERGSAPAWKN